MQPRATTPARRSFAARLLINLATLFLLTSLLCCGVRLSNGDNARPPFIPHTTVERWEIVGWMLATGNWDPSTVGACYARTSPLRWIPATPDCFDY